MPAIVKAQSWNLCCFSFRSPSWNLKASHQVGFFFAFTTSLANSRAISLPLISPFESISLLWILLVQRFSSTLSLSSNKANASCWERVVAQPLERSLHVFTACCCSVSQKQECWCPRHIPFVPCPAEIPRKRDLCSSAAAELTNGVWSKEEEESECVGEKEEMNEERA